MCGGTYREEVEFLERDNSTFLSFESNKGTSESQTNLVNVRLHSGPGMPVAHFL